MPAALAILLYELLSLEASVLHDITESLVAAGDFWSLNNPYHFDWDLGGRTNWSLSRPPASELQDGYPSTSVILSLAILLHSQSSVGKRTDTLPTGCERGPAKGLSSPVEAVDSMSGI